MTKDKKTSKCEAMNIEQLAIEHGILSKVESLGKYAKHPYMVKERQGKVSKLEAFAKAYAQQQSEPVVPKPAYDGAREDLLIWKKRALEAEEKVRLYDQRIVDIGVIAMTPIKQPSEPVAKIIHTKGTGLLEGKTITKVMLDVKYVDLPEGTQLYTQPLNTVSLEQYNKLLDALKSVKSKTSDLHSNENATHLINRLLAVRHIVDFAIVEAEMDDE